MNSTAFNTISRFILLLVVQIIVFNNMAFWGFIVPFPYILFILLYPVNGNKYFLLMSSFFLGLVMDFFMNSGGIHATACLVLAYSRPLLYKFSFGLSYEYQTVKINDVLTTERFAFILFSVVTHHLIIFLLEAFQIYFIWDILLRTLFSAVFTILCSITIIYLIKPKRR